MDTFGITPIEAAFEVIGLGICQRINEYIFKDTPLGVAVLIIGLIFSLYLSVRIANYRPFIKYVIISFALYFLLVVPSQHIPLVNSSMESYGYQRLRSRDIVHSFNIEKVPTVLAFVSAALNAVMLGAVYVFTVDGYLKGPFEINKIAFQLQNEFRAGIKDPQLKEDVGQFIYSQYLPALSRLPGKKGLWPGHDDLIKNYTQEGRNLWTGLKRRMEDHINLTGSFTPEIKNALGRLSEGKFSAAGINDAILTEYFSGWGTGLCTSSSVWICCGYIIAFFPYLTASISLMLYAIFPLVVVCVLLTNKTTLMTNYVFLLCGVKSCVVFGALVSSISFIVYRLQLQFSQGISWFWHMPYFNIAAAGLLALVPFFMVIGINQLLKGGANE